MNERSEIVNRPTDEKVCAVAGCDNSNVDGRFVGDFCAPCDTAIRTGLIGPGTSFIYTLAAENSRLRAELAYYEDEGEPPEPDGECYRGDEYAASVVHEMAEARKLK